jgi:uncharacterized protein (TIGR03435 family)
VDSTGLTAKYSFTLTFLPDGMVAPPTSEPLPDIYRALQSQVGLKLQPTQSTETSMIIDHIEKKPTQN